MIIKIVGSGCPNCHKLEENSKRAIEELALENVQFEYVREIDKIVEMGIMSMPAIVINGQVKASGRIPNVEEIKNWIE